MHNFIPFYTHIWTDKKFRTLPDNDTKILFIYLFSNSEVTLTGIYNLDFEECKLKTKLKRKFETVFDEIIASKMIEWDDKEELVFVVNRFKLIPTKSPKVIVGAIEELNHIEHHFKQRFVERYKNILEPFMFRLTGHEMKTSDILTEDFLLNAHKIYHTKQSLKNFLVGRDIPEHRIDTLIQKVLPDLK